MIVVNKLGDEVNAYIIEGLRRIYSASINSSGNYVDYDMYLSNADLNTQRQLEIPFMSVFCPSKTQKDILYDLLKEPYKTVKGNTLYKLTKRQKQTVSLNVNLGPSPHSVLRTYLNSNSHYNLQDKYTEEEIEQYSQCF